MNSSLTSDLFSESVNDFKYMRSLGLENNIRTATTDKLFYYYRGIDNWNVLKPVLVMIHGYPQSNFMWRHVIPLLRPDIPLFIPDIPGYGRSAPLPTPHSKQNSGRSILSTLSTFLPQSSSSSSSSASPPHPIILAGHDRGAHISQRLTVSNPAYPSFQILGTMLLDITPSLTR